MQWPTRPSFPKMSQLQLDPFGCFSLSEANGNCIYIPRCPSGSQAPFAFPRGSRARSHSSKPSCRRRRWAGGGGLGPIGVNPCVSRVPNASANGVSRFLGFLRPPSHWFLEIGVLGRRPPEKEGRGVGLGEVICWGQKKQLSQMFLLGLLLLKG